MKFMKEVFEEDKASAVKQQQKEIEQMVRELEEHIKQQIAAKIREIFSGGKNNFIERFKKTG
jgi:hypothetical protein